MNALLAITTAAAMESVMLTCFTANVPAQAFFRKKHTFKLDDFTPDDVDYTILSCPVTSAQHCAAGASAVKSSGAS